MVSNTKLQKIIDLLTFVLTIDDEEILRSTIQSVIESLEEVKENNIEE